MVAAADEMPCPEIDAAADLIVVIVAAVVDFEVAADFVAFDLDVVAEE